MKPVVGLLRQMGIRPIVYLDDMLIMAQSQDKHPPTRLNCPRSFRRVGLHDKLSEVSPRPFHSLTLSLALPRGKIRKVRKECQSLLDSPQVTVRQLAKLLGHLTSTIQAVFPGPLHFRRLQNEKNRALVHSQT